MMLEYKYKLKIFIEIRNFGAIMKKYRRRYGYKRILTALIAADLLAMSVCGSGLAAEVGINTSYDGRDTGFVSPVKSPSPDQALA